MRQPTFVSGLWTREGLAWVAGVVEGEGSITQRTPSSRTYWSLRVTMSDEDVVRRLLVIVGLGHITGPHVQAQRKPLWTWHVNYASDVYAVLAALWPWLGARRQAKAGEAIRSLMSAPWGRKFGWR